MRKPLIAILLLIFATLVFAPPQAQGVDYDAFIDPYNSEPGWYRDKARRDKTQGRYNNEVERRQREDDFYWDSVRRRNEENSLNRLQHRQEMRKEKLRRKSSMRRY